MDLIEYANKFIELGALIKAVYGGTEKGIYIDELNDELKHLTWYTIHAGIPNWNTWNLGIYKLSENSKEYVPYWFETLKVIGGKYLYFGFWVYRDPKIYHVYGFEYW